MRQFAFSIVIALLTFSTSATSGTTTITENKPMPIHIGAATTTITPPVGSWQQGAGIAKKGEYIRDELEANVLYLTDGVTPLLIFSCDLVGQPRRLPVR